jgi:hypothetical protein
LIVVDSASSRMPPAVWMTARVDQVAGGTATLFTRITI